MKQKIYSILLTGLFGLLGMNAWAQDLNITTIDGKEYYEIGSADDLVAFAQLVNGGNYTANAVLIANIDMTGKTWSNSIGDWQSSHMYKGKFDGQGHSITNLTITTARDYHGLFGVVGQDAEIKNFYIDGAVTVNHNSIGVVSYTRDDNVLISNIHSKLNFSGGSGKRVGGIVGNANQASNVGTATIDRCTYSGTMTLTGTGNKGGIVGYVLNNANVKTTISNCLFDGTITNDGNAETGGIIGYAGANLTKTVIKNCLSIGTINATVCGQFFGVVKNAQCSIINSYYQGSAVNGTALDNTSVNPTVNEATKVTEAQLASGEVCFALNGEQSENVNWFQSLKKTFLAEHYVITVNGGERATQTADVVLEEQDDNTYKFILPNFVLHTNSADIPVGDVVLEGVTVNDDGTFSKTGQFNVPDENIPTEMAAFKPYLQNIDYTLSGKVNGKGKRLYANIEGINVTLPILGAFAISVEVGTDDFEPKAPTGEPYPTPYGTDIIYATGRQHCDGSAYPDAGYSNENLGTTTDDHDFVDGFCSFCGTIDKTWMTANADGFFEITNEKQLVWFAAYVNQVSVAAKGKLMNNIALTKAWTTPIGTGTGNNAPGETAYTGTFDGQGYAITGFNAEGIGHFGLFGDANGATIKNFSISGNLTVTSGYGGGVVAWPINSTIENVHSALVISVPNSGTHHVGGVVGSARGGNTIDRCSFTGSLTVAAGSTDNFAGIAAYITNGDKITNCANFADVTFSDAGCAAGGIVGYVNAQQAYVQNCLTTGTILFNGEGTLKYGAAILGRTKGFDSAKVKNNYWLEGSANGAARKDDGSDPLNTGSVTTEQLASGEVAYKLGAAWSQLLGTDNTPVLGTDAPVFYVGAAGYATLYDTTSDWALNGDATAYIGTAHDTYMHLTAIDDIPAGTPVILKGTYYNKVATTATSDATGNDLLGTDTEIEADGTMYVLAKPEDKEIGFYKATGTIPAGKAYYKSTSGVKAFTFTDDDATGIADLNNLKDTKDLIYNVAGQRLNKMQKGINIVGGKKVLY